MARHGKKYIQVKEKIDSSRKYELAEAVSLVLNTHFAKFDASVDVALKLGVDPRKADQNIRGSVALPHGTGRAVRVLALAKGEKAQEAQDAGADYVGAEDMIEKIQKEGWLEFDKVVATPDMMAFVGRVGRILGPRGLMPNAKTGTVTMDIGKAVGDIKAGKVDFRVDRAGVVHVPIGRVSFGEDKIRENFSALADIILKMKPSTAKGAYIRSLAMSSTMGPGVRLDAAEIKAAVAS